MRICEECGTRFKTLPALHDITTGEARIREFRDVHQEELVGRDPVEIDLRAVRKTIARRNQPLSITHLEIKRFFMSAREAVSLVLKAFAIGDRGDTLVLDVGEPVRIVDVARTLIRISGKSEREVEISFTGLREGETLNEEIFYSNKGVHPTSFEKIKRIRGPLAGSCKR